MRETYIAFDLATGKSGVAVGNPFNGPPLFSTIATNSDEPAERGLLVKGAVRRLLIDHKPAAVFIEKPMSAHVATRIGSNDSTTLQLNGLVFVAMIEARSLGIPYELIDRQAALQHFTGQPRYTKGQDSKRACMARAQQLGWKPANFDEADAAALLDFGAARLQGASFIQAALKRPPMRRAV